VLRGLAIGGLALGPGDREVRQTGQLMGGRQPTSHRPPDSLPLYHYGGTRGTGGARLFAHSPYARHEGRDTQPAKGGQVAFLAPAGISCLGGLNVLPDNTKRNSFGQRFVDEEETLLSEQLTMRTGWRRASSPALARTITCEATRSGRISPTCSATPIGVSPVSGESLIRFGRNLHNYWVLRPVPS